MNSSSDTNQQRISELVRIPGHGFPARRQDLAATATRPDHVAANPCGCGGDGVPISKGEERARHAKGVARGGFIDRHGPVRCLAVGGKQRSAATRRPRALKSDYWKWRNRRCSLFQSGLAYRSVRFGRSLDACHMSYLHANRRFAGTPTW